MIYLSLAIATYNRAEQLMTTLASVALQRASYHRWECIVVDNNSTDNTRERVEQFIASHPELNITYHFEPQQGLSHARNSAIERAKGNVIAFIDDDERIAEDFVGGYIELFENYPDAISAGGPIIAEYPEGRPRWMSHYTEQPIANPMYFGERIRLFPSHRIPGGGNMAIRREALELVGKFNPLLGRNGKRLIGGEESDLFERLRAHAMRCYYVPKAVMYHIIGSEKLNKDYFCRLAYNTGVSQRSRAELHHRLLSLYLFEAFKWVATLLLCLVHRPIQSCYLLRMRYHISRGILNGNK